MIDYKIILIILAVVITLISYTIYFYNIFKNKTKPHSFSWFIWGLLTGIAFVAQIVEGGGIGAYITGLTAFGCVLISIVALVKYGIGYITKSDWMCFVASIFGIILWIATDNPLNAVILVTLVDFIAFIPTFRKGYKKPYEENATTFTLGSVKFIFAIPALEVINLTTVLYPASLVLTNGLLVIMLLVRRKIKRNS